MDALTLVSNVQTRILQNGRLRYYALIIFVTAFGLIGFMLFRNSTWFTPPPSDNIPFYAVAIALLILGAGLFAIITSSRLAAAMALGAVGYGIAMIYVIYSAPDLAITQILVETLTVIIFVLVVYRLPRFLKMSSTPARIRDAVISLGAGAVVTALVWKAGLVQIHTPISSYFLDNSLLKAYGQNVVNTILVDFRALDTFGEITVLAVAAFGVYALLKLKLKAGEENR
jgi:multicomponent Na+:H+ antiporter subunit A